MSDRIQDLEILSEPKDGWYPREHNWEPLPIPPMSRPPPRALRVSPAPAALPARPGREGRDEQKEKEKIMFSHYYQGC